MTYDLDLYTRWVYKIPSNRVMLGPRFPLSRPEKRAFSNSELNLSSKTLVHHNGEFVEKLKTLEWYEIMALAS